MLKLEQQVTSLELSKQIKEAGYPQEGYFKWYQVKKLKPFLGHCDITWNEYIIAVAPTVAELLKALHKTVTIYGSTQKVADFLAKEWLNGKKN